MHIDKNLCAALLTLLVVGCANKVNQPVASTRLVLGNPAAAYEAVPHSVATKILIVPDGTDVSVGDRVVSVGKKYFSAIGTPCRKLNWKTADEESDKGTAMCKNKHDERWHFTRPVIATYREGSPENG
ncbi:hypothetical protein [Lacimicrobium alkaliphilum]|uniref:Uncharacterized protein n=1 Tax=Lacimicrobium alkaliphilum TaxID=1526571 RepID=A0A0U2JJC4_9ALTE|nr:hypothetical protein [Lacimicrobium alkaliphilum]ALS99270.1 hypothetical protein AT746_14070 [Lacimicrobium alkaliphilum]